MELAATHRMFLIPRAKNSWSSALKNDIEKIFDLQNKKRWQVKFPLSLIVTIDIRGFAGLGERNQR
jgi:hypothetical protein